MDLFCDVSAVQPASSDAELKVPATSQNEVQELSSRSGHRGNCPWSRVTRFCHDFSRRARLPHSQYVPYPHFPSLGGGQPQSDYYPSFWARFNFPHGSPPKWKWKKFAPSFNVCSYLTVIWPPRHGVKSGEREREREDSFAQSAQKRAHVGPFPADDIGICTEGEIKVCLF